MVDVAKMENVPFYDLHKICRICLKTDLLVSIYSPTFLIRPVDMLTKLHIFKLPLDDLDLPTALCQSCLYRLLDAYNLQQLAAASDQRLREYIGFPSVSAGGEWLNSCSPTTPVPTTFANPANPMDLLDTNGAPPSSVSMYENICEMILDKNEVEVAGGGGEEVDLLNDVEIDVSSLTRSDIDGDDTSTYVDTVETFDIKQSKPQNNEVFQLSPGSENNLSIPEQQLSAPSIQCQPSATSNVFKDQSTKKSCSSLQRSPDQCGECGKIFHYRGYLTVHKRMHSGEKPFKCQLCPRQFTQSSKLRLHQKSHEFQVQRHNEEARASSALTVTVMTTVNPVQEQQQVSQRFRHDLGQISAGPTSILPSASRESSTGMRFYRRHQCQICLAFFTTSSNLKAHASIHLEQRNFQCSICERSFKTQRDLRRHEPIHKAVKDIICPLCSKAFNKRTYLNVHVLTVHRGIRRHKCNECNKVFGNRSNLICHLRTHTGEKPFQCSFCSWKFNQSSGLARHLKKHSKNLTQKTNTEMNKHQYNDELGRGELLNDVIFDVMDNENVIIEGQQPQIDADFVDNFENVNTIIKDYNTSAVISTPSTSTSPSTTTFL